MPEIATGGVVDESDAVHSREDARDRMGLTAEWSNEAQTLAAFYLFLRASLYFPAMPVRLLCLGDIVGRPGRKVVEQKLRPLVREKKIDLVIANAENIAAGSGITANLFHKV